MFVGFPFFETLKGTKAAELLREFRKEHEDGQIYTEFIRHGLTDNEEKTQL
jgi:hypothetical protein